jgi:c-di-AMP phosphodiesterase-like protein
VSGNQGFLLVWISTFILAVELAFFVFTGQKESIAILLAFIPLLFFALKRGKQRDKADRPPVLSTELSKKQLYIRELVDEHPEAAVVIDQNGKIIWKNKAFAQIFGDKRNIAEMLTKDVADSLLSGSKAGEVKVKDTIFSLNGYILEKSSRSRGQKLMAFCFIDVTPLYDLREGIYNEKAAVCYVQVDNFDEVMATCHEENRPELLARIDKTITHWTQGMNGFIKKYDSDKFLVVLSVKDLKVAMNQKFNILEGVKQLRPETSMIVTISIGAAYGQASMLEMSKAAQNALELCLGRGGDQAVVKGEGKTLFFGGKSKEVERYSRVRARVISHALRDLIDESDIVIVLGHVFLDMDALGAGVGIVSAARGLGKNAYILLPPEQSPSVESLMNLLLKSDELKESFISEITAYDKMTKKTLLVVVDTHKPSLCISERVLAKAEKVVVIDHHRRSEEFIQKAHLVYMEPYASSTSEMATEIIQYMGDEVSLSPLAATALLSGIVVDTRNFSFKTGVRTFEAASFLRRAGADPTEVYKLFQEDMETINARAQVVKRAEQFLEHIIISHYTEKPKNPTLSAAHAANTLLEIKDIYASFVFVPTDDGISVSARSLGSINVQRILEKLGGGGHMTVAGAQFKDMTMEQVIKKVKEAISEYIKEGEAQ